MHFDMSPSTIAGHRVEAGAEDFDGNSCAVSPSGSATQHSTSSQSHQHNSSNIKSKSSSSLASSLTDFQVIASTYSPNASSYGGINRQKVSPDATSAPLKRFQTPYSDQVSLCGFYYSR